MLDRPAGDILREIDDWLSNVRLTVSLAILLTLWYLVEWAVLAGTLDVELFQWLFTVESATRPTPGWLLAPLSHSIAHPYGHFVVNITMLLAFGGAAEPHVRDRDYLVFFASVGVATGLIAVTLRPSSAPLNGASGAIFGLSGYTLYHYPRNHYDRLRLDDLEEAGRIDGLWQVTTAIFPAVAFPYISLLLLFQLVGVLAPGRSAVIAHASGFLLGVLFEFLQPLLSGKPCG